MPVGERSATSHRPVDGWAPIRTPGGALLSSASSCLPAIVRRQPGAVAQSGSAPRSQRGGQGFKSPQLHSSFVDGLAAATPIVR